MRFFVFLYTDYNSRMPKPKTTTPNDSKKRNTGSDDSKTQTLLWSALDLFFDNGVSIYQHHLKSYNFFVEHIVPYEVQRSNVIDEHESSDGAHMVRYCFRFDNLSLRPATLDNGTDYMTPMVARYRGLNYFGTLVGDVEQIQEKVDTVTHTRSVRVIGKEKMVPIARIPIMVRSKYCVTSISPETAREECRYDPGCYFIVNGNEKLVLCLERSAANKVFVFEKGEGSNKEYKALINSQRDDIDGMSYTTSLWVRLRPDGAIVVTSNFFNNSDIPLVTLMRALGASSDQDIVHRVLERGPNEDHMMYNKLMASFKISVQEDGSPITNAREAQEYVMYHSIHPKYSSHDPEVRLRQRRRHIQRILNDELLPHLSSGNETRCNFIGYMASHLLSVALGRQSPDDRDTFLNKRVELPGPLLGQLFRQAHSKMIRECSQYFKKKNVSDENPLLVISHIKPTYVEQVIKSSLLTGNWGNNKARNGIARPLDRLSYLKTITELRKIIVPNMDDKGSKMLSMRQVHPSQMGYVCLSETPEGEKVGFVKSLAQSAMISIPDPAATKLIYSAVTEHPSFQPTDEIPPHQWYRRFRVFINGDWIGFSKDVIALQHHILQLKLVGKLPRHIGVHLNIDTYEFNLRSDGGRIVRPLLRVNPDTLELYFPQTGMKVKTWEEFMATYPEAVEYIDVEQSVHTLIAPDIATLSKARAKRNAKNTKENPLDRYENAYSVYTHCEFHPSMILGMVVSNIPFCNMNQATRNMYQFNQAKQAMGLYTTNYLNRFDIANHLSHPQIPVVTTQGMRYSRLMDMPNGENVIVAIAPFAGYNQEDSMILNATSVARGLFISFSLKRYTSSIEKNQISSKDDLHMKPDPAIVDGVKADVNYEKLNERGYVKEETVVENGDAIIGKVSPALPSEKSTKLYHDKSEVYKGMYYGVIDKVQTGIINAEGYETYNMRVRSERIPQIGDKFSSRSGQKATCGLLVAQEDMPFTANGVVPDIIINPNCIPSRMTIGQLWEMVSSKVGAMKGTFMDGTPFEKRNPMDIANELKELGFDQYGYEEMYSGITGEKFPSLMFIGPCYYQRLKHMVADKMFGRATGPTMQLTRQPQEGRAKGGGLRFGEMERDGAIAHGMSLFLKERMMECSDLYSVHVCNICGLLVSKIKNSDGYFCKACDNMTDISLVQIPYAFKLALQELMAINIVGRIKPEQRCVT